MVKVTYIDSSGVSRTIEVAPGVSVMQGAKQNDIPEITADCGGLRTCSSCHVYVDPQWMDKLQPMHKIENGLLAFKETRQPNSRLSCQILMTEDLDGLVVRTLPPEPDEDAND
ncbi:MAG: 2Fe-2S iron-sulfur cluster-binding protein [Sterolibacterium sp.]|nr:2Fe-2S iron-sulfur cluster-binding protein [Sterolibacterium sp.]